MQHLLDAVASAEQGAILQALADVVNLLAAGRAPRDLSPHLAGASLIALSKEGGDVRPIAVGEVLRRLTSKCLCSTVRASAREFFEPLQVGVGCPLGLEAAIHTMARYRDRHSGSSQKVILTIDFQNAFNTMSRSAFLRACRQQMPAVSAWASWCYASPSRLIHNKEVILSQAGVQQGDNLGPLLFSLAIHPVLEQLKVVPGVDVVIGYLDDIVVAGDAPAVLAAFRLLQAAMPDLTLALNATKCELIPTAGADSAADLSDFPSDMKRVGDGCFKFLGTPIGTEEFTTRFTEEKRANKANRLLDEIAWVEEGQFAHKLIMRCMGSARVMHAMRTTRPDWILPQLRSVDSAVVGALETCMGLALPPAARSQVSLPIRLGGLGLRSSERHGAAAYLASRVATKDLCRSMDANFDWEIDVPENGLAAALRLVNGSLPSNQRSEADGDSLASLTQKSLSRKLDEALQTDLLDAADVASRARLRAAGAPHAGAWLAALPSDGLDQRLSHAEFVACLKLILGLPLISQDSWCPRCDQILDSRCTHAMACMSSGDANRLHNELRDAVYIKCLEAGLAAEREQPNLLPEDRRRRPGDIFVPHWPGGQGVAMDFAITSPLQLAQIHDAAASELAAATAYEQVKFSDRETARKCREHGVRLLPMVAESLGGWGTEAQKAFKVLGRSLCSATGVSHGLVVAQLYQSLSVKLMRAAARSSLARAADAATSSFCAAAARAQVEIDTAEQ